MVSQKADLLQLPLIRLYLGVANLVQVILVARVGLQFVCELRRANSFRTLADDENSPSRFGNLLWSGDAFDRLIESKIQGITGRTFNDKIGCERNIFDGCIFQKL